MLLKQLCELQGVSGNEKTVRRLILDTISPKVDSCKVDYIGNIVAFRQRPGLPHIAVCAHMDEVGVMITEITADGYLKFKPVGGIEAGILVSKPLRIGDGVAGVIGLKAIHLQKPEERRKEITTDDLYIDIGALSKEEAEKAVKIGDYGTFWAGYEEIGSGLIKSKALDNRAGCALLMELLNDTYACSLSTVFTVQEEVGLRGSKVVSNYIEADLAIVVEATRANDIMDTDPENRTVELGRGPACSLMDGATIYKPELIRQVSAIARAHNISLQYRQSTAAANDAGNIHQAGAGIPTITLSIPCRYIHSMSSVISKSDYNDCLRLIKAILANADKILE